MNRYTLCAASLVVGFFVLGPSVAFAEEGRYIVAFQPGRAGQGLAALNAAKGRVLLSLDRQNAAAVMLPPQAVDALSHNPNVEYVEIDQIREPLALWNDSVSGGETLPYGVQMIQANRIKAPNPSNRTICIIDSGYFRGHQDLDDGNVTGEGSVGSGYWYNDSCGHGTHVAGTISAVAGNKVGVVGVAPGVRLHIVKVFGDDNLVDNGNCGWTYSSTLVAALNKCTTAGANIVSMSLGGAGSSRTEDRAFASAYKAGVLSIAAAGNDGNRTTSYPAGYSSVVSVAAVDANEVVASFSQVNKDVEIAAPGVSVLSTVPWQDIDTLSIGTTWAGAHIEGSARTNGSSGTVADGGLCNGVGSWSGKIVLCQRGSISFADKVANVVSGGGIAAAIYNNSTSDATCGVFIGTLGTGVTSSIPAISLSCTDGAAAVAATKPTGATGTLVSQFNAPSSGYEAWNGTSMATPHVSGVAALVWSCNTSWTAAKIREALDMTAKDAGRGGRDTWYGFGIVQAKDALQYLGSHGCTVE